MKTVFPYSREENSFSGYTLITLVQKLVLMLKEGDTQKIG